MEWSVKLPGPWQVKHIPNANKRQEMRNLRFGENWWKRTTTTTNEIKHLTWNGIMSLETRFVLCFLSRVHNSFVDKCGNVILWNVKIKDRFYIQIVDYSIDVVPLRPCRCSQKPQSLLFFIYCIQKSMMTNQHLCTCISIKGSFVILTCIAFHFFSYAEFPFFTVFDQ
jgi:hypothetical protein